MPLEWCVEKEACNSNLKLELKILGSFQSGQMGQTVNLLRELRWFESITTHNPRSGNEKFLRGLNGLHRNFLVWSTIAPIAEIAQSIEH